MLIVLIFIDCVDCLFEFFLNVISLFFVECLSGFFGINCSTKCSPPSYGKRCSEKCENCSSCHHIHGCIPTKETLGYYDLITHYNKQFSNSMYLHALRCKNNKSWPPPPQKPKKTQKKKHQKQTRIFILFLSYSASFNPLRSMNR